MGKRYPPKRSAAMNDEGAVMSQLNCSDGTKDHFPVGDGTACNCGDLLPGVSASDDLVAGPPLP